MLLAVTFGFFEGFQASHGHSAFGWLMHVIADQTRGH
jgi:hypothetical protein